MSRGDAWCRPPSQQSRLDGALSSIIHPSDLLNPNGLESQYSSLSQKLIERFNTWKRQHAFTYQIYTNSCSQFQVPI